MKNIITKTLVLIAVFIAGAIFGDWNVEEAGIVEDDDYIYYGTVYLNEEDLQNEVKIGNELPFSTRETKIRDEYADFDSILLNAVVYPDFTFDYNKNSKMYIGWTHDPHGDRDYVIWYDDELPDADWWTTHR